MQRPFYLGRLGRQKGSGSTGRRRKDGAAGPLAFWPPDVVWPSMSPMEITRDATDQSLMRLAVRLAELTAWRDRESFAMPEAKFRTRVDSDWQTVRQGDRWPRKDCPVYLQFESKLPES